MTAGVDVRDYKRALAAEVEYRRRRRQREREDELARLELAERQAAAAPVVTALDRRVPPWAVPLQQPARYKGASGGRGSGKSWFFAEEAVAAMIENPALRIVCLREVQRSLKNSSKAIVEDRIAALGVEREFDILDTEIRRAGHDGVMIFQGMQDHTAKTIKSLEGFGRAWFDEAQTMSKRSLDLLLPTIRAPQSEVWFSWNPEQPTDAIEAFFASTPPRAVHCFSTYLDNPHCTQELLDEAAREKATDPDGYAHIWLGGYFLGGHGRVYSSFLNRPFPDGNIDDEIEDTGAEILVGMDFNVNPMTCVIAQRAVDECLILDALQVESSNTEEVAAELRLRFPTPRRVVICPDPSGKARKSSAPVGQTDFTILERAGFQVRAPNAAPPVVDRENNANAMYHERATGRRRVRIHPRAKALTTALSNLTYKDGTSQRDTRSPFVHVCDAADYLLWQEFNVLEREQRASISSYTVSM